MKNQFFFLSLIVILVVAVSGCQQEVSSNELSQEKRFSAESASVSTQEFVQAFPGGVEEEPGAEEVSTIGGSNTAENGTTASSAADLFPTSTLTDNSQTTIASKNTITSTSATTPRRPPSTTVGKSTTGRTTASTTAAPSVPESNFQREVARLVNAERAKYGLTPLAYSESIEKAAQVRAAEIIEVFDHTRPNGASCFTALQEAGVVYRTAGENIAAGYSTPQQVVEGWMNSSGHRSNILNANYGKIGVGYVEGGGYRTNWVQLFTD